MNLVDDKASSRSLIGFLIASVAWLVGCATHTDADQPPERLTEWIERGSDPRYPSDEFLVGIGVGTDTDAAADDGRAAILGFFRTRIESTVTRYEQERGRTEGAESAWIHTSITTDSLKAEVQGTLEGAEVADAMRHPQSGESWALVVVNRQTLATTLVRRISQEDRALKQVANETREAIEKHRLWRARALLSDVPKRLARLEAWRTELSLVDKMADPESSSLTVAGWIELHQTCTLGLTFAIQIIATTVDEQGHEQEASPADERIVAEAIKGALHEADPTIGVVDAPTLETMDTTQFDALPRDRQHEAAAGANFLVRARVVTVHSSRFGKTHVYRSRYTVEVIDLHSGDVLATNLSGEIKGTRPHANRDIAATNSLREVCATLATDLAAALTD